MVTKQTEDQQTLEKVHKMVSSDFSIDNDLGVLPVYCSKRCTGTEHAQTLHSHSLWIHPAVLENIWGKVVPIMRTYRCLSFFPK